MSYDAAKVRPKAGWCVMLADERREKVGTLYLPGAETGVEKVTEGMSTVVRVGPGPKNAALGLAPGQRVAYRSFFRFANPIPSEEKWPSGAAKEYFLMASDDVLAILPDGCEVGVFSGRPEVKAAA